MTDVNQIRSRIESGINNAKELRPSRMKSRPAPTLSQSLYAVVGLGFMSGTYFLAGDISNQPWSGVVLSVVFVGLALWLEAKFPAKFTSGVLVGLIVAVPIFWITLFDALSEESSIGQEILIVLLIALTIAGGYFFIPTIAGYTPLLGAALIWTVVFVALISLPSDFEECDENIDCLYDVFDQLVDSTAALMFIVGLAMLIGALVMDGRRLHGAATALISVGVIPMIVGIAQINSSVNRGSAVVVILGGLLLVLIGHNAKRRFSSWFGSATVLYGIGGITAMDSARGRGFLLALVAGALGFGVWQLQKRIEEGNVPDWMSSPNNKKRE